MCFDWLNFPISVDGATGGLIGETVIICGGGYHNGYNYTIYDECYSLTSEKATLVTHMSVERRSAASIVLDDNILWVTGGYSGAFHLASTEYVTVTGTMLGPNLPQALVDHAMVAINKTCSMVIGGISADYSTSTYFNEQNRTFYYDHNEGEWITGPSLMQARMNQAAGIVTDEVTDEPLLAVTGGRYYSDGCWFYFVSTEILQDGEWVQGKLNDTICHLLEMFWSHNTVVESAA